MFKAVGIKISQICVDYKSNRMELARLMANRHLSARLNAADHNQHLSGSLSLKKRSRVKRRPIARKTISSLWSRLLPGAAPQINEQNDEHGGGADTDSDGDLGARSKVVSLRLGDVRVIDRSDRAEFRMDDNE